VDVEFNWRQNTKESREQIAEKYGPKLLRNFASKDVEERGG
jgi:hypothetical protein